VDPDWNVNGITTAVVLGFMGGTVVSVVCPFEKSTFGSETVIGGAGVNVRVAVAFTATGYGFSVRVIVDCCPTVTVVSVAETVATAGAAITEKVSEPVAAKFSGSTTVIAPVLGFVSDVDGMTAER